MVPLIKSFMVWGRARALAQQLFDPPFEAVNIRRLMGPHHDIYIRKFTFYQCRIGFDKRT